VDVFPPYQQTQVRAQLSFVLEGVLSQQLIPKMSGQGRCLCLEIMSPNPAIRNLIREDKVHQIYSTMQVGQGKSGMQTMNQSLINLVVKRLISVDDAFARAGDLDELRNMLVQNGIQIQKAQGFVSPTAALGGPEKPAPGGPTAPRGPTAAR